MSKISVLFKKNKMLKPERAYDKDDYTYTSPDEEMYYNRIILNGLYKYLIHEGIIDGKEFTKYLTKYKEDYDVHLVLNPNDMKLYIAERKTPKSKTEDSSDDKAIQTEDDSEGSTEA